MPSPLFPPETRVPMKICIVFSPSGQSSRGPIACSANWKDASCLMSRMAIAAVVFALTALPLAARAQHSFSPRRERWRCRIRKRHCGCRARLEPEWSAPDDGERSRIGHHPRHLCDYRLPADYSHCVCHLHAGTATLTLNTSTMNLTLATGQTTQSHRCRSSPPPRVVARRLWLLA